MNRITRNKVTT